MADPDLVEGFFDELSRRGHDPLLDKLDGTGRFEIVDGGRTDQWLVTVKGGYPTVSREGGEADWVMRAGRDAFNQVIHGEVGALAAVVRGSMSVSLADRPARFNLLTRLFAGPPQSRKQWTRDERWQGRRSE
jgi:hypothetical protein